MSLLKPQPPRRPRLLGIHLAGVFGVPACFAAGYFELGRALNGNRLSWAYTVEWPTIAIFAIYIWIRLVRDRRGYSSATLTSTNAVVPQIAAAPTSGADDPGLTAWQDYLANLHAQDPPGGPPPR